MGELKNFPWSKLFVASMLVLVSCAKPSTSTDAAPSTTPPVASKYLYVTTGLCTSGSGITTFVANSSSNLVLKIDASTGQRTAVLADYWAPGGSPGTDSPVGVVNWDNDYLMVLVLNGTSGRIEKVAKNLSANRPTFNLSPSNATVIATAPKALVKSTDGGLFIVRSAAVEKVNSSGQRVGSTSYVTANLGATCGTANTTYSSLALTPTGKMIFTHSVASTANRTISVPATGANTSCLNQQTAPSTSAWPTAVVYDATGGKVIVASSGNGVATTVNTIMVYDFNDTTGAFSNPQKIYDAADNPALYSYLLYSISAMHFDAATNSLYVGTANMNSATLTSGGGNYVIEKFTYDRSKLGTDNTHVLTRVTVGGGPFYNYGVDTKCISGITGD